MKTNAELRALQEEVLANKQKAIHELGSRRTKLSILPSYNHYGQYEEMLEHVLKNGEFKYDRTGVKTIGIHGHQLRFNMDEGFPLITTKKLHTKSIIYENLWFLRGETNIKYLKDHGVRIWDEWANENGDLGPVYGKQWRAWEGPNGTTIDQIENVIKSLSTNPSGRRHIVNSWNVNDLPAMALSPCHCMFQFHTSLMTLQERNNYWAALNNDWSDELKNDDELDYHKVPTYRLDLQLYQRSCDIFLGVPFNIASYSMLLLMMAQVVHMKPGTFIHDYGDLHIYSNHFDQVVEQLTRYPRLYPQLRLNREVKSIFDFQFEDFTLKGYDPHPAIKADVAV